MCNFQSLFLLVATVLTLAVLPLAKAFAPALPLQSPATTTRRLSSSSSTALEMSSSLVVISPPGGVGEVTACKAAEMGSAVRWFVVTSSDSTNKVSLSSSALKQIEKAGGTVELAGADANAILEDSASTLQAVATWCASADGLVCTLDGVSGEQQKRGEEDPQQVWKNAIVLAAQRACQNVKGVKLAVVPAEDTTDEEEEEGGGVGGLFSSLLGGDSVDIPSSLTQAMGESNVVKLRHGDLFGIPESSPQFSALAGGPLKDASLCEEYSMRSIRVDPSLVGSSGSSAGTGPRSSRHSVGQAAALMALKKLDYPSNLDVCVSSLRGTDPATIETWEEELARVQKMMKSGQGAQLFTASFSDVPDVDRLADWMAQKWAPAVMRTYDIAAIRTGARPVYAARTTRVGEVEIVWQKLDDFTSVTAGRMMIQVSPEGIVATRGPGDASKGYGSISKTPLPGEALLVSKLADAASQAVEKGLAKKTVTSKKKPEKKKAPVKEAVATVTSVQASGTVEPSRDTGPRTAGARRSSERARGKRRKSPPPPKPEEDSDSFQ